MSKKIIAGVAAAAAIGFSSIVTAPMATAVPYCPNGGVEVMTPESHYCDYSGANQQQPAQIAQLPPGTGMPPVMQGTIDPNTGKYTPGLPNYTIKPPPYEGPWPPPQPLDPWGTGASNPNNTSCGGFSATCQTG
jgi:hypothetical protein